MKKKRVTLKDYTTYNNDRYDEMKKFLDISRSLNEQVEELEDMETEKLDVAKEREKEKTEVYTISAGKLVIHGDDESQLNLTDDEKTTYQETMDDFIEQVSDLVDYKALHLYTNDVEWGGKLIKFDTEFVYTLGESNGVFITCNMSRLDEEFTETLQKLKDFYKIFSSKWAKVLANRKATEIDKGDEPANEL
jgi:hypothetical protein